VIYLRAIIQNIPLLHFDLGQKRILWDKSDGAPPLHLQIDLPAIMDIDSSSPPSHGIVCGIFGVYCQAILFIHQIEKRLGGTLQIMDATSVTPQTRVL
jgi:hypothetical protein